MGEVGTQTDLAAWLLACLDEDERVARHAIQETTGRWTHRETDWGGGFVVEDDCGALILPTGRQGNAQYPHIARWDPARVLVECDTKRKLIEETHKALVDLEDDIADEYSRDPSRAASDRLLHLLALPYRDRPGYRADEWSPDGR